MAQPWTVLFLCLLSFVLGHLLGRRGRPLVVGPIHRCGTAEGSGAQNALLHDLIAKVDRLEESLRLQARAAMLATPQDTSAPFAAAGFKGVQRLPSEELHQRLLALDYPRRADDAREALLFSTEKAEEEPLAACMELDLVMYHQRKGRCLAVMGAAHPGARHLLYFNRAPRGKKYEEAVAGAPLVLAPKLLDGDFTKVAPQKHQHEEMLRWLRPFLAALPRLEKKLRPLLRRVQRRKRVVAMTLNYANVDLLLNFLCSARRAGLDVGNLVVFAADAATAAVLRQLNVETMQDEELGMLRTEDAVSRVYGDGVFVEMMWYKAVTVYMCAKLGYDVLFQDADHIWFRDFWGAFGEEAVDVFFSDDGARSNRFSPLFGNSGFYFVRANEKTVKWLWDVVAGYDMMHAWQSHQAVLDQILNEHVSRSGLRARLLKKEDFAGGYFVHNAHVDDIHFFMQKMTRGEVKPYCFHMSWTAGKKDKLKFLGQWGLWGVTEQCAGMLERKEEGATYSLGKCCEAPKPAACMPGCYDPR